MFFICYLPFLTIITSIIITIIIVYIIIVYIIIVYIIIVYIIIITNMIGLTLNHFYDYFSPSL